MWGEKVAPQKWGDVAGVAGPDAPARAADAAPGPHGAHAEQRPAARAPGPRGANTFFECHELL